MNIEATYPKSGKFKMTLDQEIPEWRDIIIRLTAQCSVYQFLIAHLLAEIARRQTNPSAVLANISEQISVLFDQIEETDDDPPYLSQIGRQELSATIARAVALLES